MDGVNATLLFKVNALQKFSKVNGSEADKISSEASFYHCGVFLFLSHLKCLI
jgi:hypothetical protein